MLLLSNTEKQLIEFVYPEFPKCIWPKNIFCGVTMLCNSAPWCTAWGGLVQALFLLHSNVEHCGICFLNSEIGILKVKTLFSSANWIWQLAEWRLLKLRAEVSLGKILFNHNLLKLQKHLQEPANSRRDSRPKAFMCSVPLDPVNFYHISSV